MKPFAFSLERMRSYRQQVLDKEKNTLIALRRTRDEIEQEILLLKRHRAQKQAELKEKQLVGMDASELSVFRFWMRNSEHQLEDLREARAKAEKEVERQQKVVIQASQDVSALDKLEEKQLEKYRLLETRDREQNILEYVTMNLVRDQPQ